MIQLGDINLRNDFRTLSALNAMYGPYGYLQGLRYIIRIMDGYLRYERLDVWGGMRYVERYMIAWVPVLGSDLQCEG